MDAFGLFDFMQSAIEARESAKFHFTRNLSDALSLISEIGKNLDIDKEDLSFCDINVFQEMYISSNNPKEMLLRSIEYGKALHDHTCKLSLPPLIASPEDLWSFQWPEASPNFITQKEVIAEVSDIKEKNELNGKIVCIPNADPAFDWLFSFYFWVGHNLGREQIHTWQFGLESSPASGHRRGRNYLSKGNRCKQSSLGLQR